MAVIARRTFVGIRDEAIKRCGNIGASGFSSRVEYFVTAAYDEICSTYHHFELDKIDPNIVLSTSANSITLPSDCFVVVNLVLRNAAGTAIVGEVGLYDGRRVFAGYAAEIGQPTRYARFGTKLYFDKKPDVAYTSDLYYYKSPIAPDFGGAPTSPETARDVDEHIIEGAVALTSSAIKDVDFGGVNRQLLADWLASQVRNPTQVPLSDGRERRATQSTIGGAQG